jgi:hypothetical protein
MAFSSKRLRAALATNSTSTGFTAQNATTTEPSGVGVFDMLDTNNGFNGRGVPEYLKLIPFGRDGADDTFDMRVYGWDATDAATPVYIPQLLVDVSVVLSAITFTPHAAGTVLADAITVNDGSADNGPWQSIISPSEDLVASIIIPTRGCRYISFDWDLAGGAEAVSMNCLFQPLDRI